MKKRILVVCGSGIATSTILANAVRELLDARGVSHEIDQANVISVPQILDDYHLVVTTVPGVMKNVNVPVISGIPFITGINSAHTETEILHALGLE